MLLAVLLLLAVAGHTDDGSSTARRRDLKRDSLLRRFLVKLAASTQSTADVHPDRQPGMTARAICIPTSSARGREACVAGNLLSAAAPQRYLPQDADVLRTLVRHNRVQLGELGQYPCADAYAVVAAQGTVRTGDRIMLN